MQDMYSRSKRIVHCPLQRNTLASFPSVSLLVAASIGADSGSLFATSAFADAGTIVADTGVIATA